MSPQPPVLDAEHVAALMDSLRDPADEVQGTSWSVVGGWTSFFAEFVHLRSDDGTDVAVKFGRGWTAEDTEFVSSEIRRVRAIFNALPTGPVEVPPALGWSDDPAAIVLPFVDGDNLFEALGDPTHPLQRDHSRVEQIMRSAGEALGAYHSAESAPSDPMTRKTAREDMVAAARRAGYRPGVVDRLETAIPLVRGYRLSHNDFTIPDGGAARLVVLDPPHVRKFDHLHRDLSAFTLALHRALIGECSAPAAGPNAARLEALRSEVIAGYRTTGPAQLETDLDEWLLGFYELSRIGSQLAGRVRGRRGTDVVRSARWWQAERRSLGAPPSA